jgi:hypothetical protein
MRAKRLLVMLVLVAPALTARADDKTLLIELEQRSSALPAATSATGTVVVGGFDQGGGFYRALLKPNPELTCVGYS